MAEDRYVLEVLVSQVDSGGDEVELIALKSPMLAVADKGVALELADTAARVIAYLLGESRASITTKQYK